MAEVVDFARRVEKEIVVAAAPAEVWKAWASGSAVPGGTLEVLVDPREAGDAGDPGDRGDAGEARRGARGVTTPELRTLELRTLASRPPSMIAFEWRAPAAWPSVREGRTWAVVELAEAGRKATLVRVTHLGWRTGAEWDAAFASVQGAWVGALARLARSFGGGAAEGSAPSRVPEGAMLDAPDLRGLTPWVSLMRPTRPGFPENMTPEEEDAMTGHVEYVTRLRASGRLILAGPSLDAAVGVRLFFAEDEAAARRMMDSDPVIVRGVMRGTLHPYKGSFGRVAAFEELLRRS